MDKPKPIALSKIDEDRRKEERRLKKVARIDLSLIHEEHKESAAQIDFGLGLLQGQRSALRDELTALLAFTGMVRSFTITLIDEMSGAQAPFEAETRRVLLESLGTLREREGTIVMQIKELDDE